MPWGRKPGVPADRRHGAAAGAHTAVTAPHPGKGVDGLDSRGIPPSLHGLVSCGHVSCKSAVRGRYIFMQRGKLYVCWKKDTGHGRYRCPGSERPQKAVRLIRCLPSVEHPDCPVPTGTGQFFASRQAAGAVSRKAACRSPS